jgi:outer membrane protein assembly factor BamB
MHGVRHESDFRAIRGPPAAAPKFPITNGAAPHGCLMALKVVGDSRGNPILDPAWISGDFDMPDPAVIANGVVFAQSTGSNEVQCGGESVRVKSNHPGQLKALDLKTGKELFNSGTTIETWVHFSGLAVTDGRVFAVDHDSNVYAFGLPAPSSR